MRRALLAVATVVVACVLAVGAVQPRETVTVSPAFGIAGHYGTWTVTYTVGPGGIAPGGALRVQLPDTWHAGERNSANRLQASDPTDDHYIGAYGSGTDVRVEAEVESETSDFLVKSARPGLDGRSERYVFVVRADVVSGSLREGERDGQRRLRRHLRGQPWDARGDRRHRSGADPGQRRPATAADRSSRWSTTRRSRRAAA